MSAQNNPKALPNFVHSSQTKHASLANRSTPTCNKQEIKQIEALAKVAHIKDGRPRVHKTSFSLPLVGAALGGCVFGTISELVVRLLERYDSKNKQSPKSTTTAKSVCVECIEQNNKEHIGISKKEMNAIVAGSGAVGGMLGSSSMNIEPGILKIANEKLKDAYIKQEVRRNKKIQLKQIRANQKFPFQERIKSSNLKVDNLIRQFMEAPWGSKSRAEIDKQIKKAILEKNRLLERQKTARVRLDLTIKQQVSRQVAQKGMKTADYIKKLSPKTVTSILSKLPIGSASGLWIASLTTGAVSGIMCANGISYLIDYKKPIGSEKPTKTHL